VATPATRHSVAVEVDTERVAIGITWDTDEVKGATCIVTAKNSANDDTSTRGEIANDGHAVVTYPSEYHGSSEVTVEGSDGGTDTGTITV
jgi:hypothetical protein